MLTEREPYGVTEHFDRNVHLLEGGARAGGPSISLWMPGSLTVTPWPRPGMTDYEWYVPIDDRRHNYFQVLAREVDGPDGRERLCNEVKAKWATTLLHGFNDDDDVFVRENVQDFYDDELAYSQEHLIRADVVTIEWRALVSKYNRGIKTGTE